MIRMLSFALLREGTSDDGLLGHLRELILRAGAQEVVGTARDYKGPVAVKLRMLRAEDTPVDIIFVQRDADAPTSDHRYAEVARAATDVGLQGPWVAIIPIQELEAWLLADEREIRQVAARPSGKQPLGLPPVTGIEGTARPKEVLQHACLIASEATGRRREKEKRAFPLRRQVLLERLDVDGPVRQLASWQRLERDVTSAVQSL
jgi:hypothetical protein